MSNPVEIVKAALPDALGEAGREDGAWVSDYTMPIMDDEGNEIAESLTVDGGLNLDKLARAIIAALEKEGYKVMGRKPTYDVLTTLCDFLDWPYDKDHIELAKKAMADIHDAAPRYGEPNG